MDIFWILTLTAILKLCLLSSTYRANISKWDAIYIICLQILKIYLTFSLNGYYDSRINTYIIHVFKLICNPGYFKAVTNIHLVKNILIISFLITDDPIDIFCKGLHKPLKHKLWWILSVSSFFSNF